MAMLSNWARNKATVENAMHSQPKFMGVLCYTAATLREAKNLVEQDANIYLQIEQDARESKRNPSSIKLLTNAVRDDWPYFSGISENTTLQSFLTDNANLFNNCSYALHSMQQIYPDTQPDTIRWHYLWAYEDRYLQEKPIVYSKYLLLWSKPIIGYQYPTIIEAKRELTAKVNLFVEQKQAKGITFSQPIIALLTNKILLPLLCKQIKRKPKGVLFYGPPGTGKTELALFLISFLRLIGPPKNFSANRFVRKEVGETELRMQEEANEALNSPSVICCWMLDELDTLIPDRETVKNDYQSGYTNQFLNIVGSKNYPNLFVIGCTNYKEKLDKAALRSGRMDEHIFIGPTYYQQRKEYLQTHLPLGYNIFERRNKLHFFLSSTLNFTIAQLRYVVDTIEDWMLINDKDFESEEDWLTSLHTSLHSFIMQPGNPTDERPNIEWNKISYQQNPSAEFKEDCERISNFVKRHCELNVKEIHPSGRFLLNLCGMFPLLEVEMTVGFRARSIAPLISCNKLQDISSSSSEVIFLLLQPLMDHYKCDFVTLINRKSMNLTTDSQTTALFDLKLKQKFAEAQSIENSFIVIDVDDLIGGLTTFSITQSESQQLDTSYDIQWSKKNTSMSSNTITKELSSISKLANEIMDRLGVSSTAQVSITRNTDHKQIVNNKLANESNTALEEKQSKERIVGNEKRSEDINRDINSREKVHDIKIVHQHSKHDKPFNHTNTIQSNKSLHELAATAIKSTKLNDRSSNEYIGKLQVTQANSTSTDDSRTIQFSILNKQDRQQEESIKKIRNKEYSSSTTVRNQQEESEEESEHYNYKQSDAQSSKQNLERAFSPLDRSIWNSIVSACSSNVKATIASKPYLVMITRSRLTNQALQRSIPNWRFVQTTINVAERGIRCSINTNLELDLTKRLVKLEKLWADVVSLKAAKSLSKSRFTLHLKEFSELESLTISYEEEGKRKPCFIKPLPKLPKLRKLTLINTILGITEKEIRLPLCDSLQAVCLQSKGMTCYENVKLITSNPNIEVSVNGRNQRLAPTNKRNTYTMLY